LPHVDDGIDPLTNQIDFPHCYTKINYAERRQETLPLQYYRRLVTVDLSQRTSCKAHRLMNHAADAAATDVYDGNE
jgi:hypothetical protein